MAPAIEKRVLQGVIALACLVPLSIGGWGIVAGPVWLAKAPVTIDLDSHFRYISGIFFGVGLAFASCVPRIEATGARLRMLGLFVVIGGLARLLSLVEVGPPSLGHRFGLVMELGVVPLLILWQRGFARRWHRRG